MKYTIENGILSVTADTFGAELKSVQVRGKEMIWQNPTGEWASHAPVLFPVSGCCYITHKGVEYPDKFHGVARRAEFELSERGTDFLKFTLRSSAETKVFYPFDFTFDMIYRIKGDTLFVEHVVKNDGDEPLYFAGGAHESFNLDGNIDEYAIEFEEEEDLTHRLATPDGKTTYNTVLLGKVKFFPLPVNYLTNSGTFVYEGIRSRKIWLCKKDGERLVEITFDKAFLNLLLWRAKDAHYICIEPWMNMPDVEDEQSRKMEFSQKKGVLEVGVGESKTLYRSTQYQ